MSKVMMIVGILLAAMGIALALMVFFSPGPMQVYGLTAEVAAILLVGGVLALGLGGVIGSIEAGASPRAAHIDSEVPGQNVVAAAAATVSAAAVVAEDKAEEALSPAVSETIKALEKAKSDLQTAFDEKKSEVQPVTEAIEEVAEEEVADADDEGQLYVLEERMIRGHAARLLSDGTVEAETGEGWMRFENLEHLDEYLDAMEPSR